MRAGAAGRARVMTACVGLAGASMPHALLAEMPAPPVAAPLLCDPWLLCARAVLVASLNAGKSGCGLTSKQ